MSAKITSALIAAHLSLALEYLNQLPTGIDLDGVDPLDESPEDATFHVGSLAAMEVLKAIKILEGDE